MPHKSLLFHLKQTIDDLVLRAHHVRNTKIDWPHKPTNEVTWQWVFYLDPKLPLEVELVQYLPAPVPLIVSLIDILNNDPSVILYEQLPQIFTPYQAARLDELERESLIVKITDAELLEKGFSELFPEIPIERSLVSSLTEQLGTLLRPEIESGLSLPQVPLKLKRSQRVIPGIIAPLGSPLVESDVSGEPVPRPPPGTVPTAFPDLTIQILFGIRAMLLSLFDSCALVSSSDEYQTDPDYIGTRSVEDAFSAIQTMSFWDVTEFVPNVKYWKDFPLASFLDNPLPEVPLTWSKYGLPPGDPLFSGQTRKFWRRLCHPAGGHVATPLFRAVFSIAQAKKAFHTVPESFIKSAYHKHSKILSTPPSPLSPEVSSRLRGFLRSFLRNFRPPSMLPEIGSYEASTNASNTSGRSMGGLRASLRWKTMNHTGSWDDDSLIRMFPTSSGIREERGKPPPDPNQWRELLAHPPPPDWDDLSAKVFTGIPTATQVLWLDKYDFAKVRGITEPLKVRVITAMSAFPSYVSKVLQRHLWDYLFRFPCFSLIGNPLSEDILHVLYQHTELFFPGRESDWVSGDYSAATDNLNIDATLIALDEILRKLHPDDEVLHKQFRSILEPLVLIYPSESDLKPVLQKNGQLMGSVLSFVLLCLLNAFTYFDSLETSIQIEFLSGRKSWTLLPVLINGDDILFRSDSEMYSRWQKSGQSLGFNLSLGKNFYHSRFLTVNSCPVEYQTGRIVVKSTYSPSEFLEHCRTFDSAHGHRWADDLDSNDLPRVFPPGLYTDIIIQQSPTFLLHGVPNLGLLIGQSKTGSFGVKDDDKPLSGWYATAVSGALNPGLLSNFFLNYHMKEIQSQTRFGRHTLNIFAHPYLGGLGFPLLPGVTARFSEPQRALAYRLLESARLNYFGLPSEHPLVPFALLSLHGDVPKKISLGNRPGHVYTHLGSPTAPDLPGEFPFLDTSSIHATPLVSVYDDIGDLVMRPSCRLSNSELRRLLKTANHKRMDMLPVSDMTSFPFRVLAYDPNIIPVAIPEQAPTIPAPTPPPTPSLELVLVEPPPELWELKKVPSSFLSELRSFKLRSLPSVLRDEERQRNRQRLRETKSHEKHLAFQLS
jgi:hypothetical protein